MLPLVELPLVELRRAAACACSAAAARFVRHSDTSLQLRGVCGHCSKGEQVVEYTKPYTGGAPMRSWP